MIGIMGGSYDPIHVGHAIIASYMAQNTSLDQVWLMVSPENPFKAGNKMADESARIAMADMVSSRLDNVVTSDFELSMPRPSYTIDTLNALKAKHPDDEFVLIIGADNWAAFKRWYKSEEILAGFEILVYPRQGYDVVIDANYQDRVTLVDAPLIEVSSTYIREQLALGNNMSFYLPDKVRDYIAEHGLYTKK